ncbi:hypothetical protein GCM10009836_27280 [Pseudonocardia ailaonensis]|uniref:PE domain-containing protein n=1 Tax=Pseudonocardia ailaonensis TaxID=367279 RepID=A0ABN2N1F0_9PSEU
MPSPGLMRRIENVREGWDPAPAQLDQPLQIDVDAALAIARQLREIAASIATAELDLRPWTLTIPASDEVSMNLNRQAWTMAQEAQTFVRLWREHLDTAGQALAAQAEAYVAQDSANRMRSL